MRNKPGVECLKKYLDDKITEGCVRLTGRVQQALAELGFPDDKIKDWQLGMTFGRMAEHFAPEEKRWSFVNDIVDCQSTDELKNAAMELYAEDIINKIDVEFGREVEELSDGFRKKNQADQPPVA